MLLPLTLGFLHALEPDHVAAVTGVSVERERGAWKVGLAFGLSHMVAVALLALLAVLGGHALFGDRALEWLDRGAWVIVILVGLWNLSGAAGFRRTTLHSHAHAHGALVHEHPHGTGHSHRFHHGAAWLGAFFGLGGVRGFTTLMHHGGLRGGLEFTLALLLFGLGITATFIALSAASGWLASRLGASTGLGRGMLAASGLGNVAVGLWLLLKA